VELAVLMLRVVEPEVVICVRLKPGVAPEGNPLALKPTVPVNPFNAATVQCKLCRFLAPRFAMTESPKVKGQVEQSQPE